MTLQKFYRIMSTGNWHDGLYGLRLVDDICQCPISYVCNKLTGGEWDAGHVLRAGREIGWSLCEIKNIANMADRRIPRTKAFKRAAGVDNRRVAE